MPKSSFILEYKDLERCVIGCASTSDSCVLLGVWPACLSQGVGSAHSKSCVDEEGLVWWPPCPERRCDADIRALLGWVGVGMSPVDWVRRSDCASAAEASDMVSVQKRKERGELSVLTLAACPREISDALFAHHLAPCVRVGADRSCAEYRQETKKR